MTSTPAFEVAQTTETTDEFGNVAYVTVVTMDGLPAFSFTTKERGYSEGKSWEHVVSGVHVEKKGQQYFADNLVYHSVPTSGVTQFSAQAVEEITVEAVSDRRVADLDWSRGFRTAEAILTKSEYAPADKSLAKNETEAYYEGAKTRAARWDYHLRGLRFAKNPQKA